MLLDNQTGMRSVASRARKKPEDRATVTVEFQCHVWDLRRRARRPRDWIKILVRSNQRYTALLELPSVAQVILLSACTAYGHSMKLRVVLFGRFSKSRLRSDKNVVAKPDVAF
jgi:hypothetical protein